MTVLTGAGISAESGIKTFRDNNGLWENYPLEEVATPGAFQKDPELVWKFYKSRYYQLHKVEPNPGHLALMKLEKRYPDNFTLITQNVDGLHLKAGNTKVLEMHGSLHRCFCLKCRQKYAMNEIDLNPLVPVCPVCRGELRPDVVWFGELPNFLPEISEILERTDFFLVAGTSGVVYPAAQFLPVVRSYGAVTVGVDIKAPENYLFLDEFHQGKTGDLLPRLINEWLE
ncbi:MAG: NAD-dependent deacylase [Candidatus Cloacimonetes bacterium]|nr:NAD-dependent deacylase [Candidatus Cloacimonadota bacterium]